MHLSVPPLACPHACNPRSLGTRRSATSLDHCSPRFFSRFVLCIRTTVTTHACIYYGYRCKCTMDIDVNVLETCACTREPHRIQWPGPFTRVDERHSLIQGQSCLRNRCRHCARWSTASFMSEGARNSASRKWQDRFCDFLADSLEFPTLWPPTPLLPRDVCHGRNGYMCLQVTWLCDRFSNCNFEYLLEERNWDVW